jgi:hypothetical protein
MRKETSELIMIWYGEFFETENIIECKIECVSAYSQKELDEGLPNNNLHLYPNWIIPDIQTKKLIII